MFQSFEENGGPRHARARLAALRAEMERAELDAFLVPHTDEYHSEYVPAGSARLEWLTGFSGSAGYAIILADEREARFPRDKAQENKADEHSETRRRNKADERAAPMNERKRMRLGAEESKASLPREDKTQAPREGAPSAPSAADIRGKAALFTDGRYKLQVRSQTDSQLFAYEDLISLPPALWLHNFASALAAAGELPRGGLKIGFDPWLHSIQEAAALRAALGAHGELIAVPHNLIDIIWHDRPAPPQGEISLQPLAFSGRAAEDKLDFIRARTRAAGADACLLTEPAAIAWAFNLRGGDVDHVPVALGFAFIPAGGNNDGGAARAGKAANPPKAALFMSSENIPPEVKAALAPLADFAPRAALAAKLTAYFQQGGRLMADVHLTAEAFCLLAEQTGGRIIAADSPVTLPRAIKTEAELKGARAAHLRDGLAMCRFLAWIDRQTAEYGAESLDEIKAAEALENFRRQTAQEQGSRLLDISFDTISGAGADGAIIHYRVNRATNRRFADGTLYLVDSGGQYRDGTTDITRTIAIGVAGKEERRCFTLVLKGMINLSLARFPQGARGCDIDVLARRPLWQAGLDYAHGTGHGIGSYLSVHEGPQAISRAGRQELFANMIISNEPGYYREGAFGIRIENLLAVKPAEAAAGGEIPMLSFETLTLCPIDRRLIDASRLNAEELGWLNAYHAHIYEKLSPLLAEADKLWLRQATAEL